MGKLGVSRIKGRQHAAPGKGEGPPKVRVGGKNEAAGAAVAAVLADE
jgi:hypothetical protein